MRRILRHVRNGFRMPGFNSFALLVRTPNRPAPSGPGSLADFVARRFEDRAA